MGYWLGVRRRRGLRQPVFLHPLPRYQRRLQCGAAAGIPRWQAVRTSAPRGDLQPLWPQLLAQPRSLQPEGAHGKFDAAECVALGMNCRAGDYDHGERRVQRAIHELRRLRPVHPALLQHALGVKLRVPNSHRAVHELHRLRACRPDASLPRLPDPRNLVQQLVHYRPQPRVSLGPEPAGQRLDHVSHALLPVLLRRNGGLFLVPVLHIPSPVILQLDDLVRAPVHLHDPPVPHVFVLGLTRWYVFHARMRAFTDGS